ncbi:MAG: hypothetical protein KJ702_14005, partial [Gammaproteobacteria bacterium]|nr:hypothetical protein [Gammaproteobacteria bacterium]
VLLFLLLVLNVWLGGSDIGDDGNEVKKLSAGDIEWRLWGKVGTEVELTVVHKGSSDPVSVRLKRIQIF